MKAPVDRYELYRVILDYEALQEAFIDRIEDMNVSRITINEVGGFTSGYSEKLLCKPPMKTLGNGSLEKMLKATGMVLVAVIDDERFAEIKAQLSKRKKKIRPIARIKRVKGFFNKENAREMGRRRWLGLNEKQRSRIAKRAIRARWKAARRRAERDGASLNSANAASCTDGQALSKSQDLLNQAKA